MDKKFDNDKKDLLEKLLDYNFHLDLADDRSKTEALLESDKFAADVHSRIEKTLKPLESINNVDVPENLTQRSLALIKQHKQAQDLAAASASIARQQESQHRGYSDLSRGLWVFGNLREVFAVAASILLMFWVVQPGLNHARSLSNQVACMAQFKKTGEAFMSYAECNSGYLPYVHQQHGDVWWNVADKGERNESNTRNLYLLVKGEYLHPDNFICPEMKGKYHTHAFPGFSVLQKNDDFLCRYQVNYSFLLTNKAMKVEHCPKANSRMVLMADQNPLFEKLDCKSPDCNHHGQKVLKYTDNNPNVNSPNHNRRGQNVLFADGHVEFVSARILGADMDDIYTVTDVSHYTGIERPENEADVFIAP